MTIVLSKAARVGGVLLASGSTQTLDPSVEADLVTRGNATYSSDPMIGGEVPVMAYKTLTGGITKISKLTQAQYDAIVTKDDSTLYVIVA